jgi:hypothetical protein
VLLLDGGGDLAAILGLRPPAGPGLRHWCAAGEDAPHDALARLEVDAGPGLRLVPWEGTEADPPARPPCSSDGQRLAGRVARDPRPVVVDCGAPASPFAVALAAAASLSLLVIRPCYLALRRAVVAPIRPSAVVLVDEPGRSLDRTDIEGALGVPVRACVPWQPDVARAVDAGLLNRRLPRALARSLRPLGATT